MPRTLTLHSDPGHAWLAVPAAAVRATGIRVSPYSYRSHDRRTVYLEEDVDAPAFVAAVGEAFAERYTVEERPAERYSFVRGLPGYVNL